MTGKNFLGLTFTKGNDVESLWEYFKSTFNQLCNKHAPIVSVRKKINGSPWITDDYLKLARERDFLKAKFVKSGNEDEWNKYKKKRNAVNNLNKKLKREYYFSEFNEHLGDPRKTWKTLKKVSFKKKSGDRIELIKDGYVIDDPECIASIFNEYFTQTASRYDTEHTFNELHELTDDIFTCVSIGEDFVLKELSKLSIFKSSGIDNLHPRLLKLASPFITKPLTHFVKLFTLHWFCSSLNGRAQVTPYF